MRHPYRVLFVSVGILGSLLCGSQRAAGDSEDERATLRGLPGVYVLAFASPDGEQHGLTKEQVQTDAELRLRKAGIRVLSETEWLKTPGGPYLYVRVNVMKKEDSSLYAFSIYVALKQRVLTERNPKISSFATTWDTGSIGIVGENYLRDIRGSVADDVDEFINAFLAENPKK